MEIPKANPNDFKVVDFKNTTDFTFTPEMGCMYDGRPISGLSGAPGINAGEIMTVPYHLGYRLAENLAKVVQLRRAPVVDELNNPVGRPLWSVEELTALKNSFITEKYTENAPIQQTETDRLFAALEGYKKLAESLMANQSVQVAQPVVETPVTSAQVFADKQDVIAELDKRGIVHDKRASKANLEKLLA